MNTKAQIVENVQRKLLGTLTAEQMSRLVDALNVELHEYEITKQTTDIIVSDNGGEMMLRRFIATKRIEGAAETTIRRYYDINLEMLMGIGKPIKEITTDDLRFFLSIRRERNNVSNSTLDGMRRIYSSFFGWLATERYIDWNPCLPLKKIKATKVVRKSFSTVEMQRIREACKTDRDIALIDFLYYSGCRVTEVSNVNIEDIDFGTKSVTVLGKGNKERTVYLTDVCMMHLSKYIGSRISGALFMGKGTARMSKTGIEAAVKRIGKTAGVPDVHCHRFRRTLASNLIQKGVNILTVAQILGHTDIRTTQMYCYVNAADVKTAYQVAFAA